MLIWAVALSMHIKNILTLQKIYVFKTFQFPKKMYSAFFFKKNQIFLRQHLKVAVKVVWFS